MLLFVIRSLYEGFDSSEMQISISMRIESKMKEQLKEKTMLREKIASWKLRRSKLFKTRIIIWKHIWGG